MSTVDSCRLWLRGVTKHWGDRSVIAGLELELEAGSVAGIIGPNGSGKTTLLRIAAGLIRPDSGTVSVDGLDPEVQRRRFLRHVGFVSAGDRALYPRLNPLRHLRLAAALSLIDPAEQAPAIERVVDAFELAPFAKRQTQRLSLGQRQRLRLALGFLPGCDVMLLDEPSSSLDDDGLELLASELRRLRDRGGCAVVCAPGGSDGPIEFDVHYRLGAGELHRR